MEPTVEEPTVPPRRTTSSLVSRGKSPVRDANSAQEKGRDEEEPNFPPPRSNSQLLRRGKSQSEIAEPGEPPVRRPSALSRMGIASLDILPSSKPRQFEPEEMPVRTPSGLLRRVKISVDSKEPISAASDETPWHSMPIEDLYSRLKSRFEGLTTEEAAELRKVHGFNEIERPPR